MRPRERVGIGFVAVAVALAVFALGGAPRWAVALVALVAAAALASQVGSGRRLARATPLLVTLGFLAGLTLVQLAPMPVAVLGALHPAALELLSDHAALLGDGAPAWLPQTLDPPTTRVELLELGALLALGFVATRLAATSRGPLRLIQLVGAVAIAAAVAALLHRLVGATALYGVYRAYEAPMQLPAPLLNLNHFACLMALGALVCGGLALEHRLANPRRIGFAVGAGLCLLAGFAARSRGGVVALAFGAACLGALLLAQRIRAARARGPAGSRWRVALPAAILVACGLVLVAVGTATDVTHDLRETRLAELDDPGSKYGAWRSSAALVEEAPWFGVGRGGFEVAFPRVHPGSAHLTYSHLENEYLQLVVDYGLLGGLLVGFGLVLIAARALRRWSAGPASAGALAALAAVAAQSAVDFGLELLGLAVPVVLLVAALVPGELVEGVGRRRRALRWGAVAALAGWCALVATPLGRTLAEDHRALRGEPADVETLRATARRHPFDYLALGRLARALNLRRDPSAVAVLNLAMRLHPHHPTLHLIAARLLRANGHAAQAPVEYRLALAGSTDPGPILREALAGYPDVEQAASLLPLDYREFAVMVSMVNAFERPDVALRYLVALVERDPRHPRKLELLADQAERVGDAAEAVRAIRAWAEVRPSGPVRLRLVTALIRTAALDEASAQLELLRDATIAALDLARVTFALADARIARAEWELARRALEPLRALPNLRVEERREVHLRLAKVEAALGHERQAAWERAELLRLQP